MIDIEVKKFRHNKSHAIQASNNRKLCPTPHKIKKNPIIACRNVTLLTEYSLLYKDIQLSPVDYFLQSSGNQKNAHCKNEQLYIEIQGQHHYTLKSRDSDDKSLRSLTRACPHSEFTQIIAHAI